MRDFDYFTINEAAALAERFGLLKLNAKTLTSLSIKQNWDSSKFCRKCLTNSDLLEYHGSLYPDELLMELVKQAQANETVTKARPRKLRSEGIKNIDARRLEIRDARLAILHEVDQLQAGLVAKKAGCINIVIGRSLEPGRTRELAKIANARRGATRSLSRATIYNWFKIYEEHGAAGLIGD